MTETSNQNEENNPSDAPTPESEIHDLQQEIAALKAELKEKMINIYWFSQNQKTHGSACKKNVKK